MKIRLGPAGLGGVKEAINNLKKYHKLGLRAAECAYTYGVYIKKPDAIAIGKAAKKFGIKLSIHCPYWINLASLEKIKIKQSKKRILDSCESGHYLGAEYIVFHPGYYGKMDKEKVYEMIKEGMLEIQETIRENKWKVKLAPETTGKVNVFGSTGEILQLVKDTGCSFCIDFAHIYARHQGKINYSDLFDKFKKFKDFHCHFSGIEYSDKGERRHVNINSHPSFEPLAKEILKRKINITIISETPDTWKSSLKMKKIFERLGYKFR